MVSTPAGAMDLGKALGDLLQWHCQEHGLDWASEGEPFLRSLQRRAMRNNADPIAAMMQRMWTSPETLQGREFCFILNDALRKDSAASIRSAATLARGINTMCVRVPPQPPFPPGDVCYRGGGFDTQYCPFFVPQRHFRVPSYFATSFSKATAQEFLRRSTMDAKVLWIVRLDPIRHCMHVNYVANTNVAGEQEYHLRSYNCCHGRTT